MAVILKGKFGFHNNPNLFSAYGKLSHKVLRRIVKVPKRLWHPTHTKVYFVYYRVSGSVLAIHMFLFIRNLRK